MRKLTIQMKLKLLMYELAAKVRGFWADSKKLARFLSELLRQGERIATEWGIEG